MSKSPIYLSALLLLAAIPFCAHRARAAEADSLIRHLDNIIERREEFNNERRIRIEAKLRDLEACGNDTDRYAVCRDLYSLYRNYRVDSALIIAGLRLEYADSLGDPNRRASARLNLADAHVRIGRNDKALTMLDGIGRDSLQPYHRTYLFGVYASLYNNLAETDVTGTDRTRHLALAATYRDSLLACYTPDDYHYYKVLVEKALGNHDVVTASDALACLSLRDYVNPDADIEALKAEVCHLMGDAEGEKKARLRAAIIDVENGCLQGPSLLSLAKLLNAEGDEERAYNYIRAALDDASQASARWRAAQILEAFPVIDDAYTAKENAHHNMLSALLALLVLMAAILAIELLVLFESRRKLRATAWEINVKNELLTNANDTLVEYNRVKETYISELFNAHSHYIEENAKFRKNISRLIQSAQYSRALDALKSTMSDTREMNQFYARFDRIFLSLYPDFVDEVNGMLLPDRKFAPRPGRLTPELRILALMRLGIEGSAEISKMLRYSPQTVYNYKTRIRNSMAADSAKFMAAINRTISQPSTDTST